MQVGRRRVLLGPWPSLPGLRGRLLSDFVRLVHRYYAKVRILHHVHDRLVANRLHGPARVVLGFRHGGGLPVLVHVVSQRARGLRLRGAAARTRVYRPCWCCLPPMCTRSAPRICNFSKLDTQPADASVYASVAASRRPPQNSRSGWFATPFLQDSFIPDYMPVYPGARTKPVQLERSERAFQ